MDKNGHQVVATYVVVVALLSSILNGFMSKPEQLVAVVAFVIFSSAINPDIDKQLPLLKHRGITHDMLFVVISMAVLAYVSYWGLTQLDQGNYFGLVLAFLGGASFAWIVHIVVDNLTTRFKSLTWLFVIIALAIAYKLLGG